MKADLPEEVKKIIRHGKFEYEDEYTNEDGKKAHGTHKSNRIKMRNEIVITGLNWDGQGKLLYKDLADTFFHEINHGLSHNRDFDHVNEYMPADIQFQKEIDKLVNSFLKSRVGDMTLEEKWSKK